MRSVVVLPHPEGPEQADELALLDGEADGVHRNHARVLLRQILQLEVAMLDLSPRD